MPPSSIHPKSLWPPYSTPSPSGTAEVLKQYPPLRKEINLSIMTDARTARASILPILKGIYRTGERGDDGIVVGWSGDNHLIVGWPDGQPILAGPARLGDIEISYVNYELDLAKVMPGQVDEYCATIWMRKRGDLDENQ